MSITINVFIATDEKLEALASILEAGLGITLSPVMDQEEIFYQYFDGKHKWLTVGTHSLVNDKDLEFESYHYQIETGIIRPPLETERLEMNLEFAQLIFDFLKKTRKYPIMMVKDVQKKLDQYAP